MSRIEDIIRNHRDAFFEEDPPKGHQARFKARLEERNSVLWPLLKIAAVVLVIFSVSITLYFRNEANEISLGNISEEYRETEVYYKNMFDHKVNQLKSLMGDDQFSVIKRELKSMDQNYAYLKQDFKLNPEDQRIIHAMINHYQLKIEFLQQIIDQVKVNNFNNKSYEAEHS